MADLMKDSLLVFYVNVGNLTTKKAEEFMERFQKFNLSEKISPTTEIMWLPVRGDQPTKVEFIDMRKNLS